MKIVDKPTKGAKHYLTFGGAKHLGACDDALALWKEKHGVDKKIEVSKAYQIFGKKTCVACFATEVLKQLANEDMNNLPNDRMIMKQEVDMDHFCSCHRFNKSLTRKNRTRLVYLLRCIVETCCNNEPEVESIHFGKLGS